MFCPHDDTELEVYTGTIDIFGPGTWITICPTCQKISEYSETGTYSHKRSERNLVCNGLRAQIRRVQNGPAPKQGCICPTCETFIRVEEKPPTAVQNYYMDGEDVVAYLSLRDGEKVCKCYECNHKFHVFPNDILHVE